MLVGGIYRGAVCGLALGAVILPVSAALGEPVGGEVVHGDVKISATVAGKTTITQNSRHGIIDWDRFSVDKGAHVHFDQRHGRISSTLNRVRGSDPSQVYGRITAPGEVIIVNQNGVFFGRDARVDVGALVVSTADIGNQAYLSADYRFDLPGDPGSAIVNEGMVTVAEAGVAGFDAPTVINNGVNSVRKGHVVIAGAQTATLDLYGDGLVELAVSDDAIMPTVSNSGVIDAVGGAVLLTAAEAKGVVDSVVLNKGIIAANRVSQSDDGTIVLHAEQGTTIQAGLVDSSSAIETVRGGRVEVLGATVVLTGGSVTAASGGGGRVDLAASGTATLTVDGQVKSETAFLADERRSGGSIKIGGDYLGAGDTPTAQRTIVEAGALILNDAYETGDGGRTIVWADDTTRFAGSIYGRGGVDAGNGGFVETSGKQNLAASGFVDLTARHGHGNKGTYLLDPDNITIFGNVDPEFISTDGSINLDANLKIWLDASDGSTILDADGDNANSGVAFSGSIATWLDKSGNTNHATGTTATLGDIGGNSSVRFTNDQMSAPDAFGGTIGEFHNFIVTQENARTGNFFLNFNGTSSAQRISAHIPWVNGTWYWDAGNAVSQRSFINGNPRAVGEVTLSDYYKSVSDNENGFSLNGEAFNDTTSGAVPATSGGGLAIGRDTIDHELGELIAFDVRLQGDARDIVLQYQSAKWGIELTPSGTGGDEASRAMAPDGYSAFTTRYLERLAEAANISLLATNGITLDLKGDTLNLSTGAMADKNIGLTTINGDITNVSEGGIHTTRSGSGGNITFTAGGDISLSDLDLRADNGGVITLNASSGSVSITDIDSLSFAGNITAAHDILLRAGTDLSVSGATLNSTGGDVILVSSFDDLDDTATLTINNSTTITGSSLRAYAYDPRQITIDGTFAGQSLNKLPYRYQTSYPDGTLSGFYVESAAPQASSNLPSSVIRAPQSVVTPTIGAGLSASTGRFGNAASFESPQLSLTGREGLLEVTGESTSASFTGRRQDEGLLLLRAGELDALAPEAGLTTLTKGIPILEVHPWYQFLLDPEPERNRL